MENLKFKDIRQYRTKSVWRLCTPSACRFSVILPRNPLPDTKSACGISVQSAEKSDYASYAQALFSVSLKKPPVQDFSHTGGFHIIVLVSGFPETP